MSNQENTFRWPLVVLLAAFVIVLSGVIYAQDIINQLLLTTFFAVITAQPVKWLVKKKLPAWLAVVLVLVGVVLLIVGLGDVIGNSLASFSKNVGAYEENLLRMGEKIVVALERLGMELPEAGLSEMIKSSRVMNLTANLLGQLGGVLSNTFTILLLVLFLLLELSEFSEKLTAISHKTNKNINYLNNIVHSVRNYLSIKTLTSLLTGVLIWAALAIIGVDYAVLWGLLAFMFNFIPNIGSIIAAIPAILLAVIQLGFFGALWTAVAFVVVNMAVGNGIEPRVMGKGLGLSTFVVFLSLIFWGFILGTVGMFLSVPLTMAIKIMLEQWEKTRWIAVLLGTEEDIKNL